MDYCQELLKQSEVNPARFFDCIVTGDEFWTHHYDPLSQLEAMVWKRLGEQTLTRLHQERSAGNVMMSGIKMVFCSPSTCHVKPRSMVRVMHQSLNDCVLSLWRNGRGKVSRGVLLLHDNAPIDKCNIVQAVIRQAGFIELHHPAFSPDIAPINYHPFSSLKKFLRLKNFSSDDEAVTTVEDYLTVLNSEFFCKSIQSLYDRWQRVFVARKSIYSINAIIIFPQFNSI